jgi:hypothetical protein
MRHVGLHRHWVHVGGVLGVLLIWVLSERLDVLLLLLQKLPLLVDHRRALVHKTLLLELLGWDILHLHVRCLHLWRARILVLSTLRASTPPPFPVTRQIRPILLHGVPIGASATPCTTAANASTHIGAATATTTTKALHATLCIRRLRATGLHRRL